MRSACSRDPASRHDRNLMRRRSAQGDGCARLAREHFGMDAIMAAASRPRDDTPQLGLSSCRPYAPSVRWRAARSAARSPAALQPVSGVPPIVIEGMLGLSGSRNCHAGIGRVGRRPEGRLLSRRRVRVKRPMNVPGASPCPILVPRSRRRSGPRGTRDEARSLDDGRRRRDQVRAADPEARGRGPLDAALIVGLRSRHPEWTPPEICAAASKLACFLHRAMLEPEGVEGARYSRSSATRMPFVRRGRGPRAGRRSLAAVWWRATRRRRAEPGITIRRARGT